jgi:hypothetical protein
VISLRSQIEEVERELALRSRVYPRQIMAGKMRRGEAELHIERMRAVLATLTRLRDEDCHAAPPPA